MRALLIGLLFLGSLGCSLQDRPLNETLLPPPENDGGFSSGEPVFIRSRSTPDFWWVRAAEQAPRRIGPSNKAAYGHKPGGTELLAVFPLSGRAVVRSAQKYPSQQAVFLISPSQPDPVLLLEEREPEDRIEAVAVSGDESKIAYANSRGLWLIDDLSSPTATLIFGEQERNFRGLRFSANGEHLLFSASVGVQRSVRSIGVTGEVAAPITLSPSGGQYEVVGLLDDDVVLMTSIDNRLFLASVTGGPNTEVANVEGPVTWVGFAQDRGRAVVRVGGHSSADYLALVTNQGGWVPLTEPAQILGVALVEEGQRVLYGVEEQGVLQTPTDLRAETLLAPWEALGEQLLMASADGSVLYGCKDRDTVVRLHLPSGDSTTRAIENCNDPGAFRATETLLVVGEWALSSDLSQARRVGRKKHALVGGAVFEDIRVVSKLIVGEEGASLTPEIESGIGVVHMTERHVLYTSSFGHQAVSLARRSDAPVMVANPGEQVLVSGETHAFVRRAEEGIFAVSLSGAQQPFKVGEDAFAAILAEGPSPIVYQDEKLVAWDLQAAEPTTLLTDVSRISGFAYSSRYVMALERGEGVEIWLLEPEAGSARKLSDTLGFVFALDWIPGTSSVLVSTQSRGIFTLDADATSPEALEVAPFGFESVTEGKARITQDGRFVILRGQDGVYRARTDASGAPERIFDDPEVTLINPSSFGQYTDRLFVLQRNKQYMIEAKFAMARTELWVEEEGSLASILNTARVSLDGTRIVYTRGDQFLALSAEGHRTLFQDPSGGIRRFHLHPDRAHAIIPSHLGSDRSLYLVDLEDGSTAPPAFTLVDGFDEWLAGFIP